LRQQLAANPALAQQSLMTGLDVPQVVAAAINLYQQAAPEILRASPKKTPQENATRNP
jgi:hypothetical protein